MTEGEPTKLLETKVPLAPSPARNESSYRIEKIGGANGKELADGKALSVPVDNLPIAELERLVLS